MSVPQISRIREAVPILDDPPTPAAKIEDVLETSDWRPVPFKRLADAIESPPSQFKKARNVGRTGHQQASPIPRYRKRLFVSAEPKTEIVD
jgi:hypothetical protein